MTRTLSLLAFAAGLLLSSFNLTAQSPAPPVPNRSVRTNTTFTYTNTVPGSSNYFVVTAVNADDIESDPSNILQRPLLPVPAPVGPLRALPVTVTLRWKPADAEWIDLASMTRIVLLDLDDQARGSFSARVDLGTATPLVCTP